MNCDGKCPGVGGADKSGGEEQKPVENSELMECRDRLMRVTADFQNFQRRVEKERGVWVTSGQIEVVCALLPVIDDLDRALSLDGAGEAWVEGLRLVRDKATAALKDLGVEEISCEGQFDPELHEALATVESEEKSSGDVVEVLLRGYVMKDRVVRHAKVSVAK